MDQAEFVAKYADEFGVKFNPDLFIRNEDEIIEYLKKIVLACERSRVFCIKVIGFRVIEDYAEINKTIRDYEYEKFEKKNRTSKVKKTFDESRFNMIDLKESYIKLLEVKYYCSINGTSEYYTVLIKIPRVVNKYYFKLYGNYYYAMNQIVDASTYNNSHSKSSRKNKHNVSFRTTFMKTMMYRASYVLKNTEKEPIKFTSFTSNIFTKSVYTFKYVFAKYGFFEGLDFMNMRDCVFITETDPKDPSLHTFCRKDGKIFISTPKVLFDNQEPVQAMVYCIYKTIAKESNMRVYHLRKFWLKSLGKDFGNATVEKGLGIIDSLEHIYDQIVKEDLHIPEQKKENIFYILKWMVGNYNELRQKDNLDISTKRVRWSLYLACHYSSKIAKGIYRISDSGSDAKLETIRKAIVTSPDILLKAITKDSLVAYRNVVNDDDAIMALKFSYKGISGIGEKSKSAVPDTFRAVYASHLDRVDVTASSNSDPGMSGVICPLADIYNGSFSDYEEPNSWDDNFNATIEEYRKLKGKKEMFDIKKGFFDENITVEDLAVIEDGLTTLKALIIPFYVVTDEEARSYSL